VLAPLGAHAATRLPYPIDVTRQRRAFATAPAIVNDPVQIGSARCLTDKVRRQRNHAIRNDIFNSACKYSFDV